MSQFIQFVLLGLGTGAIYALVSLGLVLVYRGSGVVNFSHGAIALSGAAFYFEASSRVPVALALLAAVLGCAVIGALVQVLVMGPMRGSSPLARLVATLGLLSVGLEVWRRVYPNPVPPKSFLPNEIVDFGSGIQVPESRIYLFVVAVALGLGLWLLYRSTRFGLATAAVAENENVAAAQGWSPGLIATANWALGGALAGLGGAFLFGLLGIEPVSQTLIVIPALAAALLGGFRSYLGTVAAALALGAAQSLALLYIDDSGFTRGFRSAVPLLAIVLVLVVRGRALPLRSFAADRLPRLGTGRMRPWMVIAAMALLIGSVHAFDKPWTTSIILGTSVAVVSLSLVVLTGMAGQLSLAQFAVAGLGALFAGRLAAASWGLPTLAAIVVGVCLTIPFGLLLALPALRVRGVNLAIITLSLGVVIDSMILSNPKYSIVNFQPALVPDPTVFGIDLLARRHPTRYATFAIILVGIAAIAVANLRRGQTGRRMIAVRGNESAAASLGISVLGVKAYAFAVGSGLAALGGALIAFSNPSLNVEVSFARLRNIEIVLFSVLGGIGHVGGGLAAGSMAVGGMAERVVGLVIDTKGYWRLLAGGLLVLFVIFRPHGGVAYAVENFKSLARRSRARLLLLAAAGLIVSLLAIHTEWTADRARGTDFDRVGLLRFVLVLGVLVGIVAYRQGRVLVASAAVVLVSLVGIAVVTRLGDDLELDGTWEWTVAGLVFALIFAGTALASEIVELGGAEEIDLVPPESITRVPPKTLTLDNVSVTFGNVRALSGASLMVRPGEIVGLIGPNGAGKTTLIEAVSGFVDATGRISIDDTDISTRSAAQRSRLGIARSFQSLELFEDMTVLDNIRTAADAGSAQPYLTDLAWPRTPELTESAVAAIADFGLADVLHNKPDELPYAARRMVAIARALAAGPSIILLDEPAAGLDSGSTTELEQLIRRLAQDWGMSVLLIEHDVGLVMRTCDRIVALNFGEVIAEGTPDEVSSSPAVVSAYLGQAEDVEAKA